MVVHWNCLQYANITVKHHRHRRQLYAIAYMQHPQQQQDEILEHLCSYNVVQKHWQKGKNSKLTDASCMLDWDLAAVLQSAISIRWCLLCVSVYARLSWFIRDLRIVFFSFESNLESNRPYTTQAVTQPNGLQAYRTACYTYGEYLIHRYFVFVTKDSDVGLRTTELRTEYLFISIQS